MLYLYVFLQSSLNQVRSVHISGYSSEKLPNMLQSKPYAIIYAGSDLEYETWMNFNKEEIQWTLL